MNRYLLFAGYDYYPSGGWNDFRGDFENLDVAVDQARQGDKMWGAKSRRDWDWWHVIDIQTGQKVAGQ
jgi:hypothetical protein